MRTDVSDFVLKLVSQEICRVLFDAKRSEQRPSAEGAADEVQRIYPNCGLSRRELADHVRIAADQAGITLRGDAPVRQQPGVMSGAVR